MNLTPFPPPQQKRHNNNMNDKRKHELEPLPQRKPPRPPQLSDHVAVSLFLKGGPLRPNRRPKQRQSSTIAPHPCRLQDECLTQPQILSWQIPKPLNPCTLNPTPDPLPPPSPTPEAAETQVLQTSNRKTLKSRFTSPIKHLNQPHNRNPPTLSPQPRNQPTNLKPIN